jgi:hypothetical protein
MLRREVHVQYFNKGGATIRWDGMFVFDVREDMLISPNVFPKVEQGQTVKLSIKYSPETVTFSWPPPTGLPPPELSAVSLNPDGTMHGLDQYDFAHMLVQVQDGTGRSEITEVTFGSPLAPENP